jgi:DNA-binding LacI/PurR family transcriptional regulator
MPTRAPVTTIRDVARAAGVSVATVSRVLSGSAHPVNAATRERVLSAARRLNFQPNALARGLLLRVTSTLGALVPDVGNPYYAAVLQGAQDAAQRAGYSLVLGDTGRDAARQAEHLAVFAAKRVDGVLVLGGTFRAADSRGPEALGIPVAAIGRHPAPLPGVRIDNVAVGRLACRHLLDLGRRNVAFLAGPSSSATMRDRARGYREAMGGPGRVIWGELTADWGARAAARVEADGLVCGNDLVALGALHGLHATGRRVPEDVAVVGCDDIGIASHTLPPLTSIAVPCAELGRKATELLLGLIAGNPPPPAPAVLPVELRVRGSSA